MDTLQIINTLFTGFMFAIWSQKGYLNLLVRMVIFVLMVVNILRLSGKL